MNISKFLEFIQTSIKNFINTKDRYNLMSSNNKHHQGYKPREFSFTKIVIVVLTKWNKLKRFFHLNHSLLYANNRVI